MCNVSNYKAISFPVNQSHSVILYSVFYSIPNFPYADGDKDRYTGTGTGTETEEKGVGQKDSERKRDRIVSFPDLQ